MARYTATRAEATVIQREDEEEERAVPIKVPLLTVVLAGLVVPNAAEQEENNHEEDILQKFVILGGTLTKNECLCIFVKEVFRSQKGDLNTLQDNRFFDVAVECRYRSNKQEREYTTCD